MDVTNYSYLDLFAGAGGWSVGFEEAGFAHAAMYDFNKPACDTARKNFGDIVHHVDLSKHNEIQFPEVDIVCGSPPCQGFSNEGYKRVDDPRNSLVWSYLEIIHRIKPRVWVFENVPGFKRSYGGRYFQQLTDELRDSNYHWRDYLLDAADYGAPQHRLRFVLIAAKDFVPRRPEPSHSASTDMFTPNPYVTLWDAISDLPVPELGDRIGTFEYGIEPINAYQQWVRRGSHSLHNHTTQNHSARVLEKMRAVPMGGDMANIVANFAENKVHYCGGYRRAAKDRPSYTAYWTRGMTSIHPEQDRFLSPRECARIQTFPDRFVFTGNTIENYTQVCNAVPPLLARAVAMSLRDQLDRTHASELELELERSTDLVVAA